MARASIALFFPRASFWDDLSKLPGISVEQ